jgi:hypothetical protein
MAAPSIRRVRSGFTEQQLLLNNRLTRILRREAVFNRMPPVGIPTGRYG